MSQNNYNCYVCSVFNPNFNQYYQNKYETASDYIRHQILNLCSFKTNRKPKVLQDNNIIIKTVKIAKMSSKFKHKWQPTLFKLMLMIVFCFVDICNNRLVYANYQQQQVNDTLFSQKSHSTNLKTTASNVSDIVNSTTANIDENVEKLKLTNQTNNLTKILTSKIAQTLEEPETSNSTANIGYNDNQHNIDSRDIQSQPRSPSTRTQQQGKLNLSNDYNIANIQASDKSKHFVNNHRNNNNEDDREDDDFDYMEPCYLANNKASESITISESTPIGTIVGELMVSLV